jgi:hypothetical protein
VIFLSLPLVATSSPSTIARGSLRTNYTKSMPQGKAVS